MSPDYRAQVNHCYLTITGYCGSNGISEGIKENASWSLGRWRAATPT